MTLPLMAAASFALAGFELRNNLVDASFDSAGRLTALASAGTTHKVSGDSWAVEVGDLPFPTRVAVLKNKQGHSNATCPNLLAERAMTTVDQCAFHCMATDGCESWTAQFATWVTWGRPRLDCKLHTCAGPFGDVDPKQETSAGLKPETTTTVLTAAACATPAVTRKSASTLEAMYNDCGNATKFRVNVTYELAPEWHFVTKHLSICKQEGSGHACAPGAGFTVRTVAIWPALALDPSELELGAMALNPFSRRSEYGEVYPAGSGETASFWRPVGGGAGRVSTPKTQGGGGLFASVQTSFFETAEGFSAFRWGSEHARWGSLNYGVWTLGAAITDAANLHMAARTGSLNVVGKTAKGAADAAILLEHTTAAIAAATEAEQEEEVAPLAAGPLDVAVSLVQGQATNKPVPTPLPGGSAGVVFGASATPASETNAATLNGFAALVSLASGHGVQQTCRLVKLSGALDATTSSTLQVLAQANISVNSTVPIVLAVHVPAGGAKASVLIDGKEVLSGPLTSASAHDDDDKHGKKDDKKDGTKDGTKGAARDDVSGGGVGLIVLGQDASFVNFSSSATPAMTPAVATPVRQNAPVVRGGYRPMMKQVGSLGAWHEADPGVLGFTSLTGYEMAESGVDLGESRAFTSCVEHFLMDGPMREGKAVKLQVAWDSNEYQLDMADAADRDEYKRLIDRNAELGLDFMIYEPRNTAISTRWEHTDAWWWEEVLWFGLGIKMRQGNWEPGTNTLPPTVREMLGYFKAKNVTPAAYVYPTLAWRAPGDAEWLYESPNREHGDGHRASLASPKLQDYLIRTMNTFLKQTGGGGFAWDYGIQGDTRAVSMYGEVRGWTRIIEALRKANPKMVMDHRQIAHRFGPWYHLAGSYSEPIAGDENPESYGAALASLSTDHILADNLRLTNYRYRLQLLPSDRVPGFMFHQTERHFNNGTGDDSQGRPGDKKDANGNALWKPDIKPDPHTGKWGGITYGNCVLQRDWHTRDFDYLGYRYSVLSTIGTAGRNLVVANIPARDLEEFRNFPKDDVAWMRKWFAFADTHGAALKKTMPILGYEWPRLGTVDGTVAVEDDEGFLFLYNPSPDAANATVTFDTSLGLVNASGSWLLSEIYPSEAGMAVGVWKWGDRAALSVPGGSARVLKLATWQGALLEQPLAFNLSYSTIHISSDKSKTAAANGDAVVITGASGLSGGATDVVIRLPAGRTASSIQVNGVSLGAAHGKVPAVGGAASAGSCLPNIVTCLAARVRFGGSPSLRYNARAAPAPSAHTDVAVGGGPLRTYTTNVTVTSAMLSQLAARQAKYNISWVEADKDASWLIPSRLLMYAYVARPTPSLATPKITIDGKPATVIKQYNSRGNHAIVPAGGGAVSGNTARTFLGWYVDVTHVAPDVAHAVEVTTSWTAEQRAAHPFAGLYWHNIEDGRSTEVVVVP